MNLLSLQIRSLRLKKGITQAELAHVIGVSVQAVSKWECGGTPDVILLPAIADYFSVSIDELFRREALESNNLESYLIQLLQNTSASEQMQKACEICWSVIKGISGIPNVLNTPFTYPSNPDNDNCTRCRLCFDTGIAYVNARSDSPSIFIMPEPKLGYNQVLADAAYYSSLFRQLSDLDFMKTLLFIYQRASIPFSIEHVCSSLSISQSRMADILGNFVSLGWAVEEEVELDSGRKKLYRPIISEALIAFLFFSVEINKGFSLWYMTNISRSTPLLRKDQPLQKVDPRKTNSGE